MRITLVNNIPTHHQAPLARELHRLLGDDFRCVFLSPVDDERASMGWTDPTAGDDGWVIRAWQSDQTATEARGAILQADCAVLCTYWTYPPVPELAAERSAAGKANLFYSEPMWKPSALALTTKAGKPARGPAAWWVLHCRKRIMARHRRQLSGPNDHYLAIGAKAARDQRTNGMFEGRMWKYGYFTDVPSQAPIPRPAGPLRIVAVCRLIELKRTSDALSALRLLTERGRKANLKIVGDGPELGNLQASVQDLGLAGRVQFIPPVPFAEVREIMRQSDALFLGSTEEEGWGAVINEAMSEGCVPVVSAACGASTYLIDEGVTGFTFQPGDVQRIADVFERLADHRDEARAVGERAWEHMHSLWSPAVVAERLVQFAQGLVNDGKPPHFPSGPLSPA